MDKVFIRQISLFDTDNIVKWRNSPNVMCFLYSQEKLTPEKHKWYYENVVQTGKCSQFIICVDNNGVTSDVGTAFIKNIDYEMNSGEFGIFIGEDSARGKGYSLPATQQVLDYGFHKLGLHRIYLTVLEDNEFAIKTYLKAGFLKEGLMRDEYYRGGKYYNVMIMSIIENDWIF